MKIPSNGAHGMRRPSWATSLLKKMNRLQQVESSGDGEGRPEVEGSPYVGVTKWSACHEERRLVLQGTTL